MDSQGYGSKSKPASRHLLLDWTWWGVRTSLADPSYFGSFLCFEFSLGMCMCPKDKLLGQLTFSNHILLIPQHYSKQNQRPPHTVSICHVVMLVMP